MPSQKKSVLITGCSAGGIGGALAEVFHEKGYHVFATARNPSKISQTLATAANVTILTLDVLSSEAIADAVKSVERETDGKLDVLVNNSGRTLVMPALDVSIEDGKKLFDLNFWAPLAMLQAFSPLLIKAKGCIVNNSSVNAVSPVGLLSVYNASKAALFTASETWRRELQPLGVRTITLATCAVKTNAFDEYHGVELPETSKYFAARNILQNIADGHMQDGAISARQFATKVVREVEKGTAGTVWAGTHALLVRLTLWLSPQSALDKILESIVPLSSEMAKASMRDDA